MAGPDLTPQTFENGMRAYPGSQAGAPNALYGTWGFPAGHFTPQLDWAIIYWDPNKTSPYNDKQGAYVIASPRYQDRPVPRRRATVALGLPDHAVERRDVAACDRPSAPPWSTALGPRRRRGCAAWSCIVASRSSCCSWSRPVAARRAAGTDPQRRRVRRRQRAAGPRPGAHLPRVARHQLLLRRHGRAGRHGRRRAEPGPPRELVRLHRRRPGRRAALGLLVDFIIRWRFFNAPRLIVMVVTIGLAQLFGGIQLLVPGWLERARPSWAASPRRSPRTTC